MIRVIHLLPLFSLQKKGICRSASCDQGCQEASLDEAGCVDTLYLFITLLARIKECACNQSAHTRSSHITRVPGMAVLQNLPGSAQIRGIGSRGSTIALAPRSSSQLALQLPSTSSPAGLCTGDRETATPFPCVSLSPSFPFMSGMIRR